MQNRLVVLNVLYFGNKKFGERTYAVRFQQMYEHFWDVHIDLDLRSAYMEDGRFSQNMMQSDWTMFNEASLSYCCEENIVRSAIVADKGCWHYFPKDVVKFSPQHIAMEFGSYFGNQVFCHINGKSFVTSNSDHVAVEAVRGHDPLVVVGRQSMVHVPLLEAQNNRVVFPSGRGEVAQQAMFAGVFTRIVSEILGRRPEELAGVVPRVPDFADPCQFGLAF